MAKTANSKQSASINRTESKSGKKSSPDSQTGAAQSTGEKDENYALVSILYHALQGAETYLQYLRDAERAGDEELVEFITECQAEEVARASRARSLLAERFGASAEDDDEEEDDDDDD